MKGRERKKLPEYNDIRLQARAKFPGFIDVD